MQTENIRRKFGFFMLFGNPSQPNGLLFWLQPLGGVNGHFCIWQENKTWVKLVKDGFYIVILYSIHFESKEMLHHNI